jgi:isocitrate lyase
MPFHLHEISASTLTATFSRPYSAARIASLRGLLLQKYPSSDMALKLWTRLNAHRVNGTHEMTFGVTDPIIASQMAKYQETLYVSGALCGFSEVSEPGMDCCDYPLDTVPKVVDKIFKSQAWHSQRQNHYREFADQEKRKEMQFANILPRNAAPQRGSS